MPLILAGEVEGLDWAFKQGGLAVLAFVLLGGIVALWREVRSRDKEHASERKEWHTSFQGSVKVMTEIDNTLRQILNSQQTVHEIKNALREVQDEVRTELVQVKEHVKKVAAGIGSHGDRRGNYD